MFSAETGIMVLSDPIRVILLLLIIAVGVLAWWVFREPKKRWPG